MQKKYKLLMLLSLFSFLASSCITMPRIQKKDARNNQFSFQLQTWFNVAHPQKIDTTTRTKSDTIIEEKDSVYLDSLLHNIKVPIVYTNNGTLPLDSGLLHEPMDMTVTIVKHEVKTITKTIHDTTFITTVDVSEITAYKTQLQASRDSTNSFILKYTQATSTSRLRLIWIIVLAVLLAILGYFTIKKGIL